MTPLEPMEEPKYLAGSRRADIGWGIATGVGWWILGGGFVAAAGVKAIPVALLIVLCLFIGVTVSLMRKQGRRTFVTSMVVSTFLIPVVAVLAALGTCTAILIKGGS